MSGGMTFDELHRYHVSGPFQRWAGIELISASAGRAELRMPWQDAAAHADNGLHAGLIGGLLETACAYASATFNGLGLVTHLDVDFLNAAQAEVFVTRGQVVRNGRRQVFTSAELSAVREGREDRIVAIAHALLVPKHA